MLALYRSGRQADALETFREARRVLSEELALEPGPELRRLQDAILAHDPRSHPSRPPRRRRGNLPAPSTSFVDREEDLGRVRELVRGHRLVTLTGPPGVGKSRLALEVGSRGGGRVRRRGVVRRPRPCRRRCRRRRLVATPWTSAAPTRSARIVARLRDSDAILCARRLRDRVVDGGGAGRLSGRARRLPARAGARDEPRGAARAGRGAGDRRAAGVPGGGFRTAGLSGGAALRRAGPRGDDPGSSSPRRSAPLVAEISRRVDGLPLAIELAAARVQRPRARGAALPRRAPPRAAARPVGVRTGRAALAALVEWSYDLLHADEKMLLQALAVHRGGAAAVARAAGAREGSTSRPWLPPRRAGRQVGRLGLVPGDDARYDLLDTVREYASSGWSRSGRLAPRDAPMPSTSPRSPTRRERAARACWRAWIGRLELENENLWAALGLRARRADGAWRCGSAAAGWYFILAERVAEGRRFVELALAAASVDEPLGRALEALPFLCYLATEELDLAAAVAIGERGARACRGPLAGGRRRDGWSSAPLALAVAEAGDGGAGRRLPTGTGRARAAGDARGLRQPACSVPGGRAAGDVATVAAMAADAPRRGGRRASTRSASPRCCSRPGSPSNGVTPAPQRRRTAAHSTARGRSGLRRPRGVRARRARLGRPGPGDVARAEEHLRAARTRGRRGGARRGPPLLRGSGSAASSRRRRRGDRRTALPGRPRVAQVPRRTGPARASSSCSRATPPLRPRSGWTALAIAAPRRCSQAGPA